jgi:membrane-bound lytic murein transglycosylase B
MPRLVLLALAAFVLTACAGVEPSHHVPYSQAAYDRFLADLRVEISARDYSLAQFTEAHGALTPDQKVLDLLENQPEGKATFASYTGNMLSANRIARGRENAAFYKDDLAAVSAKTGVPPEVILALWGMETSYGRFSGNNSVVRSLTTLAFASHRKDFYRKELFNALQILKEGHIAPEAMKGSWAGAMGQCQFMPSSFLNFAADGDGDGHKDIWQNPKDVFASAANYLQKSGWKKDIPWQMEVAAKDSYGVALSGRGLSEKMPASTWIQEGLITKAQWPQGVSQARLFKPEGSSSAWLVFDNFDVIMKWNRSAFFAYSALTLADTIGGKN